MILLAALAGGLYRRWWGGGFFSSPRWLKILVGAGLGFLLLFPYSEWWQALILGVILVASFISGHGSYMDMGRESIPDNERIAPLVNLVTGTDGLFRDFVGMTIRYMIPAMVISAFCVAFYGPWGALVLLAGVIPAIVYAGAWGVNLPHPTAWGEYAIGASFYGLTFLAVNA